VIGAALGARLLLSGLLLASGPQTLQASSLGRLLDEVREEVGAPGAILGVMTHDGPPIVVASGVADRESGRPLVPEDPFYLGSVSKTYTAATVLRLRDAGRLSLDDPLARFLPDFPRAPDITVRQLLAHTSGLKDFYGYLYYRPERGEMVELVTRRWTEEELLELAGGFGHWFEPGTDWSYSSTNYYLLGVVVERASGRTLPATYRHGLFEPLGLDGTWLAWHEPPRGTPPTGYLGKVEGWEHSAMFGDLGPTTVLDRSPVEWGAGGLVAPAAEAMRFLDALMHGELLSPGSLDAMTTFQNTAPLGVREPGAADRGQREGYGLGLVRMKRAGVDLLGHGGLFTGHTAGLWHAPACGITLVLYFNRGFVDQRAVLDRVLPVVCDGGGSVTTP
jgi:D-alanyl-D-alanine carboxypeptidase